MFHLKIFQYEHNEKRPIVYIVESGFALDAPRIKGYSTKGEKCYDGKDWHARGGKMLWVP